LFVAVVAATSVACGSDSDRVKPEREPEPTPDAGDHTPDAGETWDFPRAYVGEVEGTDARVGIFGRDRASYRIYFCGGSSTVGSLTHWFNTTAPPPSDGYDYGIQVERDLAEGEIITPSGDRHAFTARPVTWGSIPGLYEANAPCGKVGVIISAVPDSDELHVQGACLGQVIADARQVNPILPLTRANDGSVEVQVEGETDTVLVKPATM
jgi:hypothetical protein